MLNNKMAMFFPSKWRQSAPALLVVFLFVELLTPAFAQVASVQFGKNRIQYRKYNWRFYQTPNFNVHFNDGGLELAKFVLQIAEEELPQLEGFTETALQRRTNIILYNSYDDMQATNVGLGTNNTPDVGGVTQLVNNKMLLYFDANHTNLRRQIREGIARVLVDNRLFGENIGEIAGNATLLDLPKWLTEGYIKYAAEPWSVEKDDELKNAMLAEEYRNFYQFAFKKPDLAGHAFWNYLANNYKKDNVTYFMYLSILYKNLNSASLRICKKKFKNVLADFMEKESEKYYQDLRGRRAYPKGTISITEEINDKQDFYHFTPNPNVRSYTYAVAEYKKGFYTVSLYENYVNRTILIKNGIRTRLHERNPNYPIMAWDGKGTRLAVVFWEKDKTKLMVYDVLKRYKVVQVDLPFDQVQDAQYFLDYKKILFSAVKNGHTDIFMYNVETKKMQQVTNDVWDDFDASFVSFPNKSGIIFSSNRPGPEVVGGDTSLPNLQRFNVFLADYDEKAGFRQITQLTRLKFGNARFPTQYNMNHFTFVADENGIGNRYAGFFSTKAEGLDTLLFIGDEILRNPIRKDLDSTLKAWERNEPDSIGYIAITKDSTYSFPITNYQSSLLETRVAGDKGQVSEVTQQSGIKLLYRLRVDSAALKRRNITPRPTDYMKEQMAIAKREAGQAKAYNKNNALDTVPIGKKGFVTDFENEFATPNKDTLAGIDQFLGRFTDPKSLARKSALDNAKLYKYKLRFSSDQILAGVNNNIIFNRFQPYTGGTGPIQLNNGNDLSWAFIGTISDVMEDYRFAGGIKPGMNFRDNEYFMSFNNYRKRLDWGSMYYRSTNSSYTFETSAGPLPLRIFTNVYQGNVSYPLDKIRSVRLIGSYRNDRLVATAINRPSLTIPDEDLSYLNFRAEYVYDNTLTMTQNIWNGLRYKVYAENITQVKKESNGERQRTFNVGADARYYIPIYRNFIWAGRAAMDISWGNQKLIYYLGGVDGWLSPKFEDANKPNPTVNYVYQSVALNLRGFNQNVANGNNALTINSEFRLPVFTTLFNKPINNAFIRNFQLVQFVDIGSAWEGTFNGIARPSVTYRSSDANNPLAVTFKAGGVGPFAGGYGFGARSVLLGYFIRTDMAWQMNGIFRGKPVWYFALGLDF